MHQGHSIKAEILGENTHITLDGLCQDIVLSNLTAKLQTKERTDKLYYTEMKVFVILGYHQETAKSSGGQVQMLNLQRLCYLLTFQKDNEVGQS